MDDVRFALKKLYPWAAEVYYTSKKGKLRVDLRYRNPNRTAVLDFGDCAWAFFIFAIIHSVTSLLCLSLIPNPIWANALFVVMSVCIGWAGHTIIFSDCSKAQIVGIWGINLIVMCLVILIVWQFQACEVNGLPNTLPKFFSFLCKFKF